jgi:hypothetical protein
LLMVSLYSSTYSLAIFLTTNNNIRTFFGPLDECKEDSQVYRARDRDSVG